MALSSPCGWPGRYGRLLSCRPPELGLGDKPLPRVSIFLSVFDVHINRVPVGGKISKVAYTPGLFLNADLDKASEDNERNGIVIDTPDGRLASSRSPV
jgi:phosphatidylserine decarboxylase